MLRHILTIGSLTLCSRVTGFLRDVVLASCLGVSPLTDAFFVAFKLPNFFRRFFAEGAFSSAFIPLFSSILAKSGRQDAVDFAQEILVLMVGVLILFVLAAQIWMGPLLYVLAPGFTQTPERFQVAVNLARIVFPYIFFISLVALFSGILNALQRFAVASLSPIALNLVMMAALLAPLPWFLTPAHGLAVSVWAAGILQLGLVYGACAKQGIALSFAKPRLSPHVRRFFKLLSPAALGAGVLQINFFVDMVFASLLPTGSISYLFYADRLNQLPLGVIGLAISTALLPNLSKKFSLFEKEEALHIQNQALTLGMTLTLPASLGLMLLAFPLVQVLFMRGAFHAEDVVQTSQALIAFASGLPAYVLTKLFSTNYFARQDTRTPLWIGTGVVGLNIALIIGLYQPLAHVGIALATALSAWVHALTLWALLWYRGYFLWEPKLYITFRKLLGCCMVLILFLKTSTPLVHPFFEGKLLMRILGLMCTVGGGAFCFLASALACKLLAMPLFLKRKAL